MRPEIRKDYIQDKYVIIAPKRAQRPHDLQKPATKLKTEIPTSCVFCPQNINKVKPVYKKGSDHSWLTYVVKNIFPAVSLDNSQAYGTQEVIIETPDHTKHLDDLPERHIASLLHTYAERTRALEKISGIDYILIFKNNGGAAGASLTHSHSQIFATRFVPPQLMDKSRKVFEYKLFHGSCVYCDTIAKESQGPRFVYQDKYVIAFTPYASLHNYEIWIIPLRHVDNITKLTHVEHHSFAKILKRILQKITRLNLPYNYYFHQLVNDTDQHLYLKIVPRGSVWAGVEIGSGLVINAIAPEDAAKYYRGE